MLAPFRPTAAAQPPARVSGNTVASSSTTPKHMGTTGTNKKQPNRCAPTRKIRKKSNFCSEK
jgi:hypothetical protein